MDRWGLDLHELAAARHGLVLTKDLRASGLSWDAIMKLTRSLYRLCHGAHLIEPPPDKWTEHRLYVRAVVLRHTRLVAVSHLSAAVMHGLPLWGVDLRHAHITGLRTARRGLRHGVHTHEGPLLFTDVAAIEGILVTNAARTVMDCARSLPLDRAVAIADHALHTGAATPAELSRRRDRLPALTGVDSARRLLDLVDGRSESPGESRSRLICHQGGLRAEPQVEIFDGGGRFVGRVDLLVEDAVVVEFDGRGKYSINGDVAAAHWREKLRHDALQEAGFVVVRLTWDELADRGAVLAKVWQGLSRARSARPPSGRTRPTPALLPAMRPELG